ncbi:hypothetical protein PtB15_4B705 [Puccinia triticina]|nr:hypothetical protein PtB15_4B705 [Puccinia triticina]
MGDFTHTDFPRIAIADIEGLVAGLKHTPSWRDDAEPSAVAAWILRGWTFLVGHPEQLDQHLADPDAPASHATRLATVWARLTRDLAAAADRFQAPLRPAIPLIIKILWLTSAAARLDHPNFRAFNLCSVQALSNLNTSNPASIAHTWPLLVHCEPRESILLRLLYTTNNRLCLVIGVLILNCVHQDPGRIESLMGSCVGKQAMTMLLERMDGLLDDETAEVFDVIVTLVREIVRVDPGTHVSKLYESQATPSQVLSPAQLAVLKVLETSPVLPPSSFLIAQFHRLAARLDQAWQGFVLVCETLVAWITHAVAAPAAEDSVSDTEVEALVQVSIRILKELSEQRAHLRRSTGTPDDQGSADKRRSMNQLMIGVIKLLTNLIELKTSVPAASNGAVKIQDAVRTLDGFPLILNATQFDVDFPYLREHAIVLLKYLLKDNPTNQLIIQNLQPLPPP